MFHHVCSEAFSLDYRWTHEELRVCLPLATMLEFPGGCVKVNHTRE